MKMGRLLSRLAKLALQILLGDLHIPQGHADIFVAEQFHQSGKADAEADHFRSKAMS